MEHKGIGAWLMNFSSLCWGLRVGLNFTGPSKIPGTENSAMGPRTPGRLLGRTPSFLQSRPPAQSGVCLAFHGGLESSLNFPSTPFSSAPVIKLSRKTSQRQDMVAASWA